MQVCCPNCQTQIDCETVQISGTVFACPQCATAFNLQDWVAGVATLSGDDFSIDEKTRTFDSAIDGELQDGDRVGKFKILHVVGRGGFGNVYKAYDEQLERIVALKIPRQDTRSQIDAKEFIREAQMAASVRDSNIVGVHEVGEDGSTLYICTDFIEGETLKGWMQSQKRSNHEICQIMIRIARSLGKAHETGLVHRDLKPANILVDKEDNPYLTDFGLARKFIKGAEGSVGGKVEIVGTPAYMSPEQAIGKIENISSRTDIYSMGVMLYEFVAGRRPFVGEVATVIQDILYNEPEKPSSFFSSIPKALEAIILKAMSKDQSQRYISSFEFADDLERYLKGEPTKAMPLKGTQHLVYFARKNKVAISIVLFVMISIGCTYMLSRFYFAKAPEIVEVKESVPKVAVSIETIPARASVAIVPVDPDFRRPLRDQIIQPEGMTPLQIDLPQGEYLIEAYLPGLGVQEVRRTVSRAQIDAGEDVKFAPINLRRQPEGLAKVEGGEFEISYDPECLEKEPYTVSSFYIQTHEVSCGEYQKVMGEMPQGFESFNRLKWNDQTPVTRFDVNEAREFAERIGMRLIDYEEYCFVATNLGTTGIPWGEITQAGELKDFWTISDVGSFTMDQTQPQTASLPVFGLFSNVPELTGSTIVSEKMLALGIKGQENSYAIVGQPLSLMGQRPTTPDLPLNARHFGSKTNELLLTLQYPVGFRCVRSVKPRFLNLSKIQK